MALKGNLADFSTTQILNLINLANKSGVLHLYEPVVTNEMITDGTGKKRPKAAEGPEAGADK